MSVFELALEELKKEVGKMEISPKSLMTIGKLAMEIVENTDVKGEAQKELVVRLVESIIKECNIDNNIKEACTDMIGNGTLSTTVELLVSASKGEFNINKITPEQATGIFNTIKKLLTMCFKK